MSNTIQAMEADGRLDTRTNIKDESNKLYQRIYIDSYDIRKLVLKELSKKLPHLDLDINDIPHLGSVSTVVPLKENE